MRTKIPKKTRHHQENIISSIPFSLWKKIEVWGRDSGFLSVNRQSNASDLAYKVKGKRSLTENDLIRGMSIFDIVCENNIELLEEADELATKEKTETTKKMHIESSSPIKDMTLKLVEKMVAWDKRRHILEDWKWRTMDDVLQGRKPFTDRMKYAFYLNLEKLKKAGFE